MSHQEGAGSRSRSWLLFMLLLAEKGLHPSLDLCPLNIFLKKKKFKMLTLVQVLSVLDPGHWIVALDLQDAYCHVSILQAHLCYLMFMVGQEHFQFAVLPFGLTSAPPVFTKVMAVVAAHLWRSGVPASPTSTTDC